jgi:hypothetical protein
MNPNRGDLTEVRQQLISGGSYAADDDLGERVTWINIGGRHRLVMNEVADAYHTTINYNIEEPPYAVLTVIGRISSLDFWLSPNSVWESGAGNAAARHFADASLTCTLTSVTLSPFVSDFAQATRNLQELMGRTDADENAMEGVLVADAEGEKKLRLSHQPFKVNMLSA